MAESGCQRGHFARADLPRCFDCLFSTRSYNIRPAASDLYIPLLGSSTCELLPSAAQARQNCHRVPTRLDLLRSLSEFAIESARFDGSTAMTAHEFPHRLN